MKNILDFETLAEFLEYFKDEETCRGFTCGLDNAFGVIYGANRDELHGIDLA
jgi:hypothetical protein